MQRLNVILVFMAALFVACSNDSPTDPEPPSLVKLYYGYFMHDWQSVIPQQAIDEVASYTNTLFIDGNRAEIAQDLSYLKQTNSKAILSLNTLFRDQLATDWDQDVARMDTLWASHSDRIAAICAVQRPYLSEHRVSATNWKFWTKDEIRDAVNAVKIRFSGIPVMVIFAADPQLPERIPENIDWIGLEYFPFTLSKEPGKDEFFDGWSQSGQGQVWGLNDYIVQISSNEQPEDRSVMLVAQSFGDDIQYKFPEASALQWYFDAASEHDIITGLLWWRAFDPFWDQTAKHGIYPYKVSAEQDMLIEQLPNIIKLQREMGERIETPW